MSGLDTTAITAIYDALVSHAQALGIFDQVNDAELTAPPGSGVVCAIMLGDLAPARAGSGLAATSGRLEFQARVYAPRLSQTPGAVDRLILGATCTLLAAYSGDFELDLAPDGLVREIDLLGAYGTPLSATAQWLMAGGDSPTRVMTISLPLIINDMWGQTG